jgi:uncharacterized protein
LCVEEFTAHPGRHEIEFQTKLMKVDSHLSASLIRAVRAQYRLEWAGLHGATHWARVLYNGLILAELTGARTEVVALFAMFHDACRLNDGYDPEHGSRGAELAAAMRGKFYSIEDSSAELLFSACRTHTEGTHHPDVTVRVCWDADRLDLWRVGIMPDPRRLTTAPARSSDLLRAAVDRSARSEFPFRELFEEAGIRI